MEDFMNHEHARLQETLGEIALTSETPLQCAERSYNAAQQSLQKIKEFITTYTFYDQAEEIRFFKVLKPQFLKQLIYYWKLFHIEAEKLRQDGKELKAWYKQKIEHINLCFQQNHHFHLYCRLSRSDKDERYFTREADGYEVLPEYSLEIDKQFCTVHSLKLAKLQAYEMLSEYLHSKLYALQNPSLTKLNDRPDANWTDSKVDLIELGYSIQSRGSVNNGKADVKLVMTALEYAFNISTGNYYAVFQQNIRIRKKSRTVYIDKLKDALDNRMDDTDE
ncbi:RteC domain-containing protein [Mucilaginibacter sp. dw_454]|uniref:RteC domain-containing protein n=1 Tax=Mucilaginibacter sp. dw_454 TaxID=2720079 RepID=UPI001BD35210|nr:RteC domain-containing protein [Mucilaginibacter sp. dw_454]